MATKDLVNDYETFSRKLIYIIEANNESGNWPAFSGSVKVGDASIDDLESDLSPNSKYLRGAANKRVKSYMGTSGVPYILDWAEYAYRRKYEPHWFRDHEIHKVLEDSKIKHNNKLNKIGKEWYMTNANTVKKAISAYKNGKTSLLNNKKVTNKIELRPEQKEAIAKTKQAFSKKKNYKMLWNAKMRFGKTLTALQLIKEEKYKKVLIITHRPIVNESWHSDFDKINMGSAGYSYGSKNSGKNIEYLYRAKEPFIYFASLQDLSGSKLVKSNGIEKNELLAKIDWDLIIIDEAHEGTQTDLAKKVINILKKDNTKLLELSGTPFNILDQYNDDQVFTWDYVMEQNAKNNWSKEHGDIPNPYSELPSVSMYTFEMKDKFKNNFFIDNLNKSFNFKEFFRVDKEGQFVYEDKVKRFLDNITSPSSRTNYPFSTRTFRNNLRHTLWILPGIREAKALKNLMENHPVFGKEYKIINIVDNGDDTMASESDVDRVNDAIGKNPYETKTITLTVRKLTTGVTIKPWTGVVFLSNTNSSMQYLQASFRAQTPYSDVSGMKTKCYIFDFAPDRALTVMAGTSQLSVGAGRLSTREQRQQMKKLLNFLPIIGEENQRMKQFNVDKLLTKLKRVYAEKAVRTGFDDDSIYNDELLKLDNVDLKDFNNLKAIVGTTKSEKTSIKIKISDNGLTDEEYDKANKARDKAKKDRTPEEQADLDKANSLKKQKKTMISILRSISIRIPMMIYGMDVDLNKDIRVKDFVENVDDDSWAEFMPKGVTKDLFIKFSKYYDSDIFIEAGKIIRKKVKELDEYDPLERVRKLAEIFGTFRNPDKETVLTPWRVVNIQLGKTIGGLSFFDDNYENTTFDGKKYSHWINTNYTDSILNTNSHILEINSKTGLYPLYVTASIYYRRYKELIDNTAGKFTFKDELDLWKEVLKKSVFVIAKTPMAKTIAQRTLTGYRDMETNIQFVDKIIENAKKDVNREANEIKKRFKNMKFDAVVGNPPYQIQGKGSRYEPIYNSFMDLSYKLADVVTLITPGRFLFDVGQTPSKWNNKMLNDKHFKVIKYYTISSEVFPNTDIKGGVAITLRDSNEDFGKIGTFTLFPELNGIIKKVDLSAGSISDIVSSRGTYRFSSKFFEDFPNVKNKLGKGTADMVVSNVFSNIPEAFSNEKIPNSIELIGRLKNKRVHKYIKRKYIQNNPYLYTYNVLVPKSNGTGAIGEVLSTPLIGTPLIGATDTFISIGHFNSEYEAMSLLKYLKTKFARVMLGIRKVTQDNSRSVWNKVPIQNFTSKSDVDWDLSIEKLDKYFYKKYDLSKREIEFIKSKVRTMN